jgi:predicted metal-dependent phosphoesterase TrpH
MRVGGGELIGLFLSERVPQGLGPVESAQRIRDQGGVVYVPHPFDPMRNALRHDEIDLLVGEGLIDVIEGLNAKTSLASLNQRAVDYGTEHGLAIGAGSDAHVPAAIGAAYLVMPDFDGPASFKASVARGRVVGHHYDEPRPWTPRIVPSIDDPIAT